MSIVEKRVDEDKNAHNAQVNRRREGSSRHFVAHGFFYDARQATCI